MFIKVKEVSESHHYELVLSGERIINTDTIVSIKELDRKQPRDEGLSVVSVMKLVNGEQVKVKGEARILPDGNITIVEE